MHQLYKCKNPLIPIQTAHLTIITDVNSDKQIDSDVTGKLPQHIASMLVDPLVLPVVITGKRITIGFIYISDMLCGYHNVNSLTTLNYKIELLQAALYYLFFILDNTVIQWIINDTDNLFMSAYQTLRLAKAITSNNKIKIATIQRTEFYKLQIDTTAPLTTGSLAVILQSNGAILLSKTAQNPEEGISWELPGGKAQYRESPVACLVRELKEELGICILPDDPIPLTFAVERCVNIQLLVCCYLLFSDCCQQPQALEQQQLAWVTPKYIHHYPMQVNHQLTFYQLAYLLGRYSMQWAEYSMHLIKFCEKF